MRDVERSGVVPVWEELGIGADMRFDPATNIHSGFTRHRPENLAANRPIVDLLQRVADDKGAALGQIAQKPWIVPIPGTRDAAHMAENWARPAWT